MKTIIIDDDPFVLKLLTQQMKRVGADDIECFEHGQDALDFVSAQGGTVGLILCDLQMPGIDGVEIVRNLGTLGYAGGLVLISGEDHRILQTAGLLASAHRLRLVGTLQKPVSIGQLRELLGALLSAGSDASSPKRAPRRSYGADELRHALADGQLTCHVQPKVAVATGRVAGVECLARWQHPQDGLVFPDQFIPLAEQSGLIDMLTHDMLRTALRLAQTWQQDGLTLSVAVNVSMDNLSRLDFPEQVTNALRSAGVSAEHLVLEVTESQLMKDRMAALDIVTRLRLKHVGLSIDDFGTGHSSFAQLRDIPFTELKIDRGFVHDADTDPARRSIVLASLRLAKELGLAVVAEGVEDLDDWNFLRESGCDMAQGYFIARPMPGADLPIWIQTWSRRFTELVSPL